MTNSPKHSTDKERFRTSPRRDLLIHGKLILLVGAGRFERPTPCAQGRCATRLRYAPTFVALLILSDAAEFA